MDKVKDDFKKKVLEEKIFKEQKDSYFKNIDALRTKYKGYNIDFTDVYRKITNYQIKKYGTSLHCYRDMYQKGDGRKQAMYAERRRYAKRHRGESNFDKKYIK